MDWSKPEVVDVNMSAEIGAYQDDADQPDQPVVVSSSWQSSTQPGNSRRHVPVSA
jgi:hypothetical protein